MGHQKYPHVVTGKGTYIGGVMGAGKSLWTIGEALRDKSNGFPHLVAQHSDAPRGRPDEATSRSGLVYKGTFTYRQVSELVEVVEKKQPLRIYQTDVHFADQNPAEALALYRANKLWLEEGRDIIIDTLERDVHGDIFAVSGMLYCLCDVKRFLTITCQFPECEAEATYNQRLHFGRPVHMGSPRFEPDTAEFRKTRSYEARCRKHFSCPQEIDPMLKSILDSMGQPTG